MDIRNFSFGGAAAIVTSLGLIIGLDAASASRATIVGGLLIVAIADNLTDSLSIHMYQESERLDTRKAFRATLINFATRLSLSLSFVLLMISFPPAHCVDCFEHMGFPAADGFDLRRRARPWASGDSRVAQAPFRCDGGCGREQGNR
jgi:hypothetical protein